MTLESTRKAKDLNVHFTFYILFEEDDKDVWVSMPNPEAESVHSALVSAVSKAKMSDFTESLAP